MTQFAILIGIAAGLASALLYASVLSGAFASVFLAYASPLPLFIAGLGWGVVSALTGSVVVSILMAILVNVRFGAVYFLWVGVPALVIVYLALLSRTGGDDETQEWYPPGRLMIWICILSTALLGVTVLATGPDLAGFEKHLRDLFNGMLARVPELKKYFDQQPGMDAAQAVTFMVSFLPPASVGLWTASTFVCLWIGAVTARASGRLTRPWPALTDIAYPTAFAFAFAICLIAAMVPGVPGLLAGAFAVAAGFAFFVLGLMTVHVLTSEHPARPVMLGTVYALLLFLPWLASPILVAIGLAECILGLRLRRFPPASPGHT